MKFMGLDIGGANTDCCIIEFDNDYNIISLSKNKYYLPFWIKHEKLPECLKELKGDTTIDVVCVSITAELADCYKTKRQGIIDITRMVESTFKDEDIYYVTFDGLKNYEYVTQNPLSAAAANWIGTVNLIKHLKSTCIFMDMGTTTTDIIPIKDKHEISQGYTDTQRLMNGELVYTGLLRTNVATIVNHVYIESNKTNVSSEYFTITADIHRILGHISEEQYTCDTPDGADKSITSCKNRLTRLVCGDIETISNETIIDMAEYIFEKQVQQVEESLKQVVIKTGIQNVVLSDIGLGNICRIAADNLKLDVVNLNDYIPQPIISIITTLGAIQMYLDLKDVNINILEKIYNMDK